MFEKGGFFVWPIIAVSIFGMTIVLERYFALYLRFRMDREGFLRGILGSVDGRQYQRALGFCNEKPNHPLSRVLKAGLMKANKSDKEIERAMEEEIIRVAPLFNKRIDYLNMFGNLATLLGLLGTLFGLSTAFEGIGVADATLRAGLLTQY
jgi:biopolymer transport protein ExbB/TolQ